MSKKNTNKIDALTSELAYIFGYDSVAFGNDQNNCIYAYALTRQSQKQLESHFIGKLSDGSDKSLISGFKVRVVYTGRIYTTNPKRQ